MSLWGQWYRHVRDLRGACSRSSAFAWLVLVLVGLTVREDHLGVTSLIRTLALKGTAYPRLLHVFRSTAISLERITELWIRQVRRIFKPVIYQGSAVLLADGIKIPKEGRKMPAVKKLHQESSNNSKSPFIMGHSFQALSLLVSGSLGSVLAVPLVSRIHEGLVFSNRDRRSLLDKLASLFLGVVAPAFDGPLILVADAFYASRKIVLPLLSAGHHLVTRVRSNAVAYLPPPRPPMLARGRPRKYGQKISLRVAARETKDFECAASPFPDETTIKVRYRCLDLIWRPVGELVRFVIVDHPLRGSFILMTTKVSLAPMEVLLLYGHRFKIELGFRQAVHTLASYGYHFWMKSMDRIKRCSGSQHLHRKTEAYRKCVLAKLNAYHLFVQLACIAQGLLVQLAATQSQRVWKTFRSWYRTMNTAKAPSERIVADALRVTASHFLRQVCPDTKLRKIMTRYQDRRLAKNLLRCG